MKETLNSLSEAIIGSAIAVHREPGPGLLESAYEACLEYELLDRGYRVERQKELPLSTAACASIAASGSTSWSTISSSSS